MTSTATSTATRTLTDLVDAHLAAWSEPDAGRRRAEIESCWEADGGLADPPLDGLGHAGIDALMAAMQEHYPGHRFVRTSTVDAHHDVFRVGWDLRDENGQVALSGIDVGVVSEDGKLQRIAGFFGDLDPAAA